MRRLNASGTCVACSSLRRLSDGCGTTAQQIAALPDYRSHGEWRSAHDLFEVRLEDDRQTSNLLAFPVLYVAYRSESSLTFFSLFRARLARRGSRRWYPLRGGLPDPARNGQVPLAGRQPPGPPRHPPPGDPRPARGVWGGGGPAGGGGGILTALTRLGWGVGGYPPLKNPPFLGGVKNRCFLGKPPNLPTVSRG